MSTEPTRGDDHVASRDTAAPSTTPGLVWTLVCATLWLLLPLMRVQIARVIPFDLLILGVLLFVLFEKLLRRHKNLGRRRPLSLARVFFSGAGKAFYLCIAAMVVAGFLSGLHARDLELWAIEVATFGYIMLMLWAVDVFTARRFDQFLHIGAWVFAGISVVCGVVAGIHFTTGVQIEIFWDVNELGQRQRFVGMTRYANQWSGYCVMVFPLLLAYGVSAKQKWHQVALLGSGLIGFLSVIASGSRSGTFLYVAEAIGFVPLFLAVSRSGKIARRVAMLGGLIALSLLLWGLFSAQLDDSHIAQRSFGAFELVDEGRVSDDWRDYNRAAGMVEFTRHPLIGIGLGTFELLYDRHEVHSSYVSLLAEAGGALGFLPYLGVLVMTLLSLVRALLANLAHKRSNLVLSALSLILTSAMIFGIHHNTLRQRYVWVMLLCCLIYSNLSFLDLKKSLRRARMERVLRLKKRLASVPKKFTDRL